jgi:hypothetical protein
MPTEAAGKPEVIEAGHGERMIEVRVRFWTNELADGKGKIRPKHAWDRGVVVMERNPSHGISPKNPRPFNSIMQLPAIIEKVLIAQGVKLHAGDQTRKLLSK